MIQEITLSDMRRDTVRIKKILEKHDCVLVRSVPVDDNNHALIELSLSFGKPTRSAINDALIENDFVHLVKSLDNPLKGSLGYDVLSTTNRDFDLHTDEYFAKAPADYLFFHCVIPDNSGGGASVVSHVNNILPRLSKESLATLRKQIFPHAARLVPVIYGEHRNPRVRFNLYEIANYYQYAKEEMPSEMKQALEEFSDASQTIAEELSLQTADCLVVNNKKMLHGRRAFNQKSGRLIKRVRIKA